jgi:hypothetical protein
MYPRAQLARALQMEGLIKSIADYFAVAEALERGDSPASLLSMPALGRWPVARRWLKDRL